MELAGKVALVTGGGGGIGAGIAEAFVEKGAKVALSDVNPDYARAEAERIGGGAISLQHDVTSLDSWARVKSAVEAEFGQVDVLCNNAGVALPFQPFEDVEPDEFARVMTINVTGVYNGCKTFIAEMKARKAGHIVNTSSLNGLVPFGSFATYCASKFAVAGMSEALCQELAPFGVGVSILYPGLTRSRMSEGQMPDQDSEAAEFMRRAMMEPVWLGRAVARAVETNTLHIITHPEHRDGLAARFDAILAAHGDPAQPGYPGYT
ncbi:MAG: SDR family oxidoreductase [Novosphingobium sp.]|nr:SDR family oxidoreductase [Novosphingobium sp.]MCP5402585.1 SDR family oxidoreductase [Novosphingobium sp.]